ncbi:MAG TPA: exopolysaccharide biosynthesis polyprenyl glycosylphosphotransferase, partial [Candidatus Didemnitutus sp.]|nr:exopolysaccharide biosynthesis polyprenyl glycosylphosphotransferase [Candidatus Didemnitutus sp.]
LVTAIILDAIVIFLALVASSWLRFETRLADFGSNAHTLHWTDYVGHILFGTALFSFMCVHFKVYSLPLMLRYRSSAAAILKSACVWVVAYIAIAFLLRFDRPVSRVYVFIAFLGTTTSLLVWRHLFHRFAIKAAVNGRLRQRVLFVDWSVHATALVDALVADRQHLYEIVGCVPPTHEQFTAEPPTRVRRLGGHDRLADLLRRQAVDMVILADLNPSDEEMVRLANCCEKEMVEFKVIPSCFQTFVSGLHLETLRGVPVLSISHLPLDNPFHVAFKQLIDFFGALVGLVISAPLIAIFGLLVYLESPGPIFYWQRRLGRDGTPFWICKLRSMKLDAERDGRVGWSKRDDPRRLRIGAFIRRWNIDETPQFWNVLKGEMSLVGPRPERPELIVNFKEEIPHYNARHHIKPGITGWAQVNGFRGDTDLTERVRYDLYYIENWNPLFDFQIMFLTLFSRKNAC